MSEKTITVKLEPRFEDRLINALFAISFKDIGRIVDSYKIDQELRPTERE